LFNSVINVSEKITWCNNY